MAKKLTKTQQDEQDAKDLAEAMQGVLADYKTAAQVARGLFETTTPTSEMIIGCHAAIFDWDTAEEQAAAVEDLKTARGMAKEIVANPEPALVFEIFDELFACPEEDEK